MARGDEKCGPASSGTSEGPLGHENQTNEQKKGKGRVMSTHVFGLTVATLADASRAARTVDHAVTLVDEVSQVVVVVDQRGRVIMRPQERQAVA
jgi:hypothetical protein